MSHLTVIGLAAVGAAVTGLALAGASGGPVGGSAAWPGSASPATAPTVVSYTAPLPDGLRIVRGFDPPATLYGPGHLGVDLSSSQGSVVRSAADGVVRFAGEVAGRGVVVVLHADGITTEYEPLRPAVRAGQVVERGTPIGDVMGRHRGCPAWCLHWGARRGAAYLDPLALLRPLAPVRLLPWPRDG